MNQLPNPPAPLCNQFPFSSDVELSKRSLRIFKSHFLIDQGSEFMGPSESSNNGLLFIKYRKIDHGKSIDFFPIPILTQAQALLLFFAPNICQMVKSAPFLQKCTLQMICHNFQNDDPINILLGGDVRYDPFSTLHTLKILLPVSCLAQVAHKAGAKISCENTCQMQKAFVKKGILVQNGDHIRDFRHLLYFIIPPKNYWFF